MSYPALPVGVTNHIEYGSSRHCINYSDSSGYFYISGGYLMCTVSCDLYIWGGSKWSKIPNFAPNSSVTTTSDMTLITGNVSIYSDINKSGYFYQYIAPQPFAVTVNVDTKRKVIINQIVTMDTKRKIGRSENFLIDTKRIIEVILNQVIYIDTKRKVLKNITFNADTKRKILKAGILNIDTKRVVSKPTTSLIDTFRKVNKSVIGLIDTKRKLISITTFPVDTDRKTLPYDFLNKAIIKCYLQSDLKISVNNDIKITQNDYNSILFYIIVSNNNETVNLSGNIVNMIIDTKDNVNFCSVVDEINGVIECVIDKGDTLRAGDHFFKLEILTADSKITTQRSKFIVIEDLNK